MNMGDDTATSEAVDVLVAGGGMGGVAAAIAAARQGVKTLLIERHGRLGGMGVNALVSPLMGWVKDHPLVDEILQRLPGMPDPWGAGFQLDTETADIDLADMVLESGAEILLHAWLFDAIMEGNKVCGVRALTKQGVLAIKAKIVIDATGDGDVAFAAGAPFEQGRDGDRLLQPMSIMFKIGGLDAARGFVCGSEEAARECPLPGGSWHDLVQEGIEQGELPPEIGVIRIYASSRPGERVINDIHNPAGAGQAAGECAVQAKPYDIPYGCLVPRATDGLLLCGRCISGSHGAHASYRVQKICMATGAAAGAAAALAARSGRQPREVEVARLQEILGIPMAKSESGN